MWTRDDFVPAYVDAGMWVVAQVHIQANNTTINVYAGLREFDELFLEGNSQHTHYKFKFETARLPFFAVGDQVTVNGDAYTVKDMPALVGTGWFSICQLKRTSRSYPKRPIIMGESGLVLPPPPSPPPAGSSSTTEIISRIAAQALGGHRVVIGVGAADCDYADNTIEAHGHKLLGVTTGAAASGAAVLVQNEGELEFSGWSWAIDGSIYLGTNGQMTQAIPGVPAAFVADLGYAMTATKMFIDIKNSIYLE